MRVLLVHPSPLMYSEVYLKLEPLGLERVAQALRAAGHEVRLLDLQIFSHKDYVRELDTFKPRAVGFSLNYLANVPEVLDLAVATRSRRPETFIFAGGHSASFITGELLEHAAGALDCIVRGEGEITAPRVLEALGDPRLDTVPGVVTRTGAGPAATMLEDLDRFPPARDLTRHRRRYFIGVLDPCASAEFTRGCPWDCSFCSAWTFYGRSYRKASAEGAAEDLARIAEPNVFLVDDVAFIHPEHGHRPVTAPYPGTESWLTESRRLTSLDYRLFDVQHAVLPTTLPLRAFYEELVKTQGVLNRKHLGLKALRGAAGIVAGHLMRGQTNFVRSLFKWNSVYHPDRQSCAHACPAQT